MTETQEQEFESAVADIQLLGSKEQVVAIATYIQQHASSGGAQIDSVLLLLRKDLRKELDLFEEVEHALIFRFTRKNE